MEGCGQDYTSWQAQRGGSGRDDGVVPSLWKLAGALDQPVEASSTRGDAGKETGAQAEERDPTIRLCHFLWQCDRVQTDVGKGAMVRSGDHAAPSGKALLLTSNGDGGQRT